VLRGRGDGTFAPVPLADGGALLPGEVRRMALVRGAGGRALVVAARNSATPLVLRAERAAGAAPPAALASRR
jgi:hypothetical protein